MFETSCASLPSFQWGSFFACWLSQITSYSNANSVNWLNFALFYPLSWNFLQMSCWEILMLPFCKQGADTGSGTQNIAFVIHLKNRCRAGFGYVYYNHKECPVLNSSEIQKFSRNVTCMIYSVAPVFTSQALRKCRQRQCPIHASPDFPSQGNNHPKSWVSAKLLGMHICC